MFRLSLLKLRLWLVSLLLLCLPIGFKPVSLHATQDSSPFSESYHEARSKFLSAARDANGVIRHYKHPFAGINDEELFVDVAAFNLENADNILVLGSGTHGVEGFAGSAIQTALLQEGFATDLKPGVGVLFYHALNPYGFSHLRRVNEQNIDLNRNFVDHSQPYPANEKYDQIADLLEPTSLASWTNFKTKTQISLYRLTKGKSWLQRAISQGQYTHPKGLFFGGHSESWSSRTLRQVVDLYLSKAKRVILIDFHTGLGEHAAAEVIIGEHPDSLTCHRAKAIWGNVVKSPELGESVSPPIRGSLKYAFARMLPAAEVTSVSLEFGTYPLSDVFWALWRENYSHHHQFDQQMDEKKIKGELLRVFYPESTDWKEAVLKQGKAATERALSYLENGSSSN